MKRITRKLAVPLAAAGISAAVLCAPVATAAPDCVNTGPTTTQCSTRGSTAIVTSPPATNFGPQWGFGWGIGGFGLFI